MVGLNRGFMAKLNASGADDRPGQHSLANKGSSEYNDSLQTIKRGTTAKRIPAQSSEPSAFRHPFKE